MNVDMVPDCILAKQLFLQVKFSKIIFFKYMFFNFILDPVNKNYGKHDYLMRVSYK